MLHTEVMQREWIHYFLMSDTPSRRNFCRERMRMFNVTKRIFRREAEQFIREEEYRLEKLRGLIEQEIENYEAEERAKINRDEE
jgi:hypothetical protein